MRLKKMLADQQLSHISANSIDKNNSETKTADNEQNPAVEEEELDEEQLEANIDDHDKSPVKASINNNRNTPQKQSHRKQI